jgi:hypothetical protein
MIASGTYVVKKKLAKANTTFSIQKNLKSRRIKNS